MTNRQENMMIAGFAATWFVLLGVIGTPTIGWWGAISGVIGMILLIYFTYLAQKDDKRTNKARNASLPLRESGEERFDVWVYQTMF